MATGGSGRPLPTAPTRLRDIAVPAYGPTLLVSIGQGAILPLVALSARDLGAGIGLAAFFVALIGLGQLVGDLPAGALAARIGEQRALVGACVLDAVALLGAFLAPNLILLAVAIVAFGLSGAVFSLARLSYLTEAIPIGLRARGMATLGGTFRVGLFVGPFVGRRAGDPLGHLRRVRLRRRGQPGRGDPLRVPARRDPASSAWSTPRPTARTAPCCPCWPSTAGCCSPWAPGSC